MPIILETANSLKEYLGKEIGVSEWLAITQERVSRFAEVTEDRQWIHVDRERAKKESPFGTTIAHGFLTLSLVSHFMSEVMQVRGVGMAVNYGLNRVRFPAPVRVGSRIRGRIGLVSFKELAEGCEVTFSVAVEIEGGEKPCCVAEWVARYYR